MMDVIQSPESVAMAYDVPPWSEAELRDKIEGARKYGDEPIGGRLDVPPMSPREPSLRELALTDSGNAEYFAHRNAGRLRYVRQSPMPGTIYTTE